MKESDSQKRARLLEQCPELTNHQKRVIDLDELIRYVDGKKRRKVLDFGKRMIQEGFGAALVFDAIEFMLGDVRDYFDREGAPDISMICPRCNDHFGDTDCYFCEGSGWIYRWMPCELSADDL